MEKAFLVELFGVERFQWKNDERCVPPPTLWGDWPFSSDSSTFPTTASIITRQPTKWKTIVAWMWLPFLPRSTWTMKITTKATSTIITQHKFWTTNPTSIRLNNHFDSRKWWTSELESVKNEPIVGTSMLFFFLVSRCLVSIWFVG